MENRCLLYCVKNDGFFVERIKQARPTALLRKIKSECQKQIIPVYGRRNFFAA